MKFFEWPAPVDTQACPYCHVQVRTSYLAAHCREVHGKMPDGRVPEVTRTPCPHCKGRIKTEQFEEHLRGCRLQRR